ncbi:MAG: hypothetical protein IPK24_21565 [Kineosporiaceae bacterium]|nr:hypothetical protein [Kineosporiaceae bacterium]MBK8078076.1 hypothetical protein [Kineosporiaceae bacterium]
MQTSAQETSGFYLNLASEDGSAAGQLGVNYLDGRQISYFTFDIENHEIAGSPRSQGPR